jgi:hypothetical protein
MVNRYSQRYQPAMFNPVSFEQYASVPLMAQQKHDKYTEDLTAQKDKIQSLPWHDGESKRVTDALDSQIEEATTGLINSKKGIYDVNTAKQLGDIRNYKDQSFNPVKQQIEGAVNARQELKERYSKLVDKGEYDEAYANEALALFDKNSKGLMESGNINYDGRVLAYDPDINKKVMDAAKSKPMQEFVQDSGWQVDANRGAWINTKTGVESNGTPKELVDFAKQFLMSDEKAMNHFRDKTLIETSLYATEKDEMGNILYNNKAYNPEELTSTLFNEKIERAASIASDFAVRNTNQTQDMRNLTDWQLNEFGFIPIEENEIVKSVYTKNQNISDIELDKMINPLPSKLIDKQGNNYSKSDFIKKLSNLDERYKLTESEASTMYDKIVKSDRLGHMDNDFLNFETEEFTNDEARAFLLISGEVKVKTNRNSIKPELDFERKQYNSATGTNLKYPDFIKVKKEVLKNTLGELNVLRNTIPEDDYFNNEIVKTKNLSLLQGMEFKIIPADDEAGIPLLGVDAGDKLNSLMADGDLKISGGQTVIFDTDYTGGREFRISSNGKSYTIITEAVNESDKIKYKADAAIAQDMSSGNFGVRNLNNFPIDNMEIVEEDGVQYQAGIKYRPDVSYNKEGKLQTTIEKWIVNPETGESIEQVNTISLSEFRNRKR